MTTEQILLLDCTKEENKIKLNKFLYNIKPIKKFSESGTVQMDVLEKVIHGLCERYSYRLQQIWTYEEEGKFKFYHMGIIHKTDTYDWIGNVNGKTLWEVLAKGIINIYADILEENKKNET